MHVFAHNGRLEDIVAKCATAKKRFRPVGETDSEIAFCMLADHLSPLWNTSTIPALDYRLEMITQFAEELRSLGPANFLYSDGDALFAHGHRRIQASGTIAPPGLWLLHRECAVDTDGLQGFGVTVEASGKAQVISCLASSADQRRLATIGRGRVSRRQAWSNRRVARLTSVRLRQPAGPATLG